MTKTPVFIQNTEIDKNVPKRLNFINFEYFEILVLLEEKKISVIRMFLYKTIKSSFSNNF